MDDRQFVISPCEQGSINYKVKRYRERAEALRTIAEDVVSGEYHAMLVRLAESSDETAVSATLHQL